MQDGGPIDAMRKQMGQKKPSLKKTLKYVKKHGSGYNPPSEAPKMQDGGRTISEKAAARKVAKGKGTISKSYPSGPEEKGSYIGYSKEAKKSDSPFKSMKDSKPARPIMKTGGMVNSNAKVSALKVAGTKGTKSGVNSKVSASKVAKGRSGGVSKAPKKANP